MNTKIKVGNHFDSTLKAYYPVEIDITDAGKENMTAIALGASGGGKTVGATGMAMNLAAAGYPVLAIDIHSTLAKEQIYPAFTETFEALVDRIDGYTTPIPCHLLKPKIYSDGTAERPYDRANSLADLVVNNYGFGVAQYSELADAFEFVISNGNYKRNGLAAVGRALKDSSAKSAKTVSQRLSALFRHDPFIDGDLPINPGRITVLDLSKFDPRTQRILAEFILFTVWHETVTSSNPSPLFILIDEFQHVGMGKDGILSKILAEGRKYGLNCILITQSLDIYFKSPTQKLLCQARYKFFFRPSEADVKRFAALIGNSSSDVCRALKHLPVGHCLVTGPFIVGGEPINPDEIIEVATCTDPPHIKVEDENNSID